MFFFKDTIYYQRPYNNMTKNTLKQLIRECVKESLNENKMDVIARKAARKNPDKNMGENKMDRQPAYVSRGETRQSRRDQLAIAKLFAELKASRFMKDPVLFMAAETSGDEAMLAAVDNIEVNRRMGQGTVEAVPVLRKDDDGYNHIEIDLGYKDSSNKQKGFLKVYGNPNSDGLRVIDSSGTTASPLSNDPSADYMTEDAVLKLIRDKISEEVDDS